MRQTSSTLRMTGKVCVGRGRNRSRRGQGRWRVCSKRNVQGDGDGRGRAGEAALLVKGEKELAKLLLSNEVGGLASEHGQLLDVAQIGLLGCGCQTAQLHVLGHPLS